MAVGAVICQRDGTVWAFGHGLADGALDKRVVAAPVEQQDTLLAARKIVPKLADELRGKRRAARVRLLKVLPKCSRKRPTVCGVSEISGTITITPRPRASTWRMTRKKTSVFPEPVTP